MNIKQHRGLSVLLSAAVLGCLPIYAAGNSKPDARKASRASEDKKDATIAELSAQVTQLQKERDGLVEQLERAREAPVRPGWPFHKAGSPEPPQARAVADRIRFNDSVEHLRADLGPPTYVIGDTKNGTWMYATADGWADVGIYNDKVIIVVYSPILARCDVYPKEQAWYALKTHAKIDYATEQRL